MRLGALKFVTTDLRYGVSIDESMVKKILMLCREAADTETGGILVGYYEENLAWAVVTDISGPPEDSRRTRGSLLRGVKGLQKWLNYVWRSKRHYYLGEWHYHPFASPDASRVDVQQLKENSENRTLVCPEPVMLIVGGNPKIVWKAKCYVYPKGKGLCIMKTRYLNSMVGYSSRKSLKP